jgi:beta-lactam-binding protein with PASTA domain
MSLVLLIVALVSALITMQLAVHGREVRVPQLAGKSPVEARRIAEAEGLTVAVEREYYSEAVPEGKVLSQIPAPGTIVRRGWELRLALSLGRQRVAIPDVVGVSDRAAAISITERGLSLGATATAQLQNESAGQVIAQDPAPNTTDAFAPKVSILVAQQLAPLAFVMPSFLGQPLGGVGMALKNAGFAMGKVTVAQPMAPPLTGPGSLSAFPGTTPGANAASVIGNIPAPAAGPSPASVVMAQDPAPGAKVTEGAVINLVVR